LGLGLRPNQPKLLFAKSVFGKKHLHAFAMYFYPCFVLISAQTSPFSISENSRKIWISFVDLFVSPSHFVFFFFLFEFCFFSAPYLIYGPLLLNTNLLCNAFFYSCLKRANKKKGKKGIEYFFSSLKIQNFTNLFT
jgi:hypothetical protein